MMSLAQEPTVGKTDELLALARQLGVFVERCAREGEAAHVAERGIWDRLLALGRAAFQVFLNEVGSCDQGATVELPDGRVLKRFEGTYSRLLLTIFGSFTLARPVYGVREAQAQEFVPLDTRLQLPESKFSYTLQDWDQLLATQDSYTEVSQLIERILGFRQSVDSLERVTRQMATEVEAFHDARPTPPPEEEGEILVASGDGKGIPIRRPADAPRIHDHQHRRGPKKDRKRMAIVGTAYTVDPFVRTPEEVVEALFRRPEEEREKRPRPRPCHKQLYASLTLESPDEDEARDGLATVFGWLGEQCRTRNPEGRKATVCVMDGQETLWEARESFLDHAPVVEVLDLLHVTPRLWQAAHLFHSAESEAAEHFVRERVLRVLRGEGMLVVRGLRQMATKRGLAPVSQRKVETICQYLEENGARMKYDQYLTRGYPIASGVIEGACRHFVKDRMERAGMSWTKPGAQAMLHLRATYLNGDWDAFQKFRMARETQRLYPHRALVTPEPRALAG